MNLPALALALALLPTDALPPDPWPQLPPEDVCAAMARLAGTEVEALDRQLDFLGGPPAKHRLEIGDMTIVMDGPRQRGGWRVRELERWRLEAERVRACWHLARDVRRSYVSQDYRRRQAEALAAIVGAEAFWRGELPLPLDLR